MQAILSFKSVERQEVVSTTVDRTNTQAIVNIVAMVIGTLVIASSIASCIVLGESMGLLTAILLSFVVVSSTLLVMVGVYFSYRRASVFDERPPKEQEVNEDLSHSISSHEEIDKLLTKLVVAEAEALSLRTELRVLQLEKERGQAASQVDNGVLLQKNNEIFQLQEQIKRLRKEHAAILNAKDKEVSEAYADVVRQTSLRMQLDSKHQQEMDGIDKATKQRMQFLERELSAQETKHSEVVNNTRQRLCQSIETLQKELTSELETNLHLEEQLKELRKQYSAETSGFKEALEEKEEYILRLQKAIEEHEAILNNNESEVISSAYHLIEEQKVQIGLLESMNIQLRQTTRKRTLSL